MNNKMLLIVIALIVLGGGAYVLSQSKTGDTMMPKDEEMMEKTDDAMMEKTDDAMMKEDEMMEKDDAMMKSDSRYREYTPEAYQAAAGQRRVLYFYANWCPTCRPADAAFQANMSQIPDDVIVFRVNYNDTDTDQGEKDLAAKHGVTYQHTFVQVDAQDNDIKTWNGGGLNELLGNIQ